MAESKKRQTFVSPAGIAVFPRLNAPDTKFKAEGEYSVKLRLDGEDAEKFKAVVDQMVEAGYAEEKAKLPKGKNLKRASNVPYAQATDSEGNDIEGSLVFKFSMKAHVKTKAGKEWDQRPSLFSANRTALDPSKVKIGGGSKLKVAFEPFTYNTPALGCGTSLRLQAVQVLELVSFGEKNAEGYGFGEEEGYAGGTDASAADPDAPAPSEADAASATGEEVPGEGNGF